MKLTGNTIFITGGGSGIGQAFAHRFRDLGNTVIIGGRDLPALNESIAGRDGIGAIEIDVTDPSSVEAAARRLGSEHPDLNVLVNNAGVMRIEDIAGSRDLGDAETVVATNLLGPIRMTNAFVDRLAGRADATILNISSGLAFVPLVSTPTYCATKAGIHSYSIALRERLRGRVEVIELLPPGLQTELTRGQSQREGLTPLGAFIDQVFDRLGRDPAPEEIVLGEAEQLRGAVVAGKVADALAAMLPFAEDDLAAHERGER